ncbi:MAG: hypothetical protein BGN97_01335 [Microbacterium sp. 69-10]|uniref:amidohydrolase family protein n=1 Tax=Microbacterium sp. 69-10 TaxID=1895783 RepID=UPI0009669DA2|nr:hydrolase [Microbacterium sp. 69-10]OJU40647.1 MAG: hypothetical protein BGN97_01335 [Microbacterium sp. 69-10]
MSGFRRVDGGMVTGRFTDHHVHLQLVDHALLAGSRLGRVVDLGGNPAWVAGVARHNSGETPDSARESAGSGLDRHVSPELWSVTVEYAGAFLTAPGGYPSDRSWAPAGSVREIADAGAAASAVDELAAIGASCIKVVAHSEAGPVLDDDSFRAAVAAAKSHGLPVVAHAEGSGQAQRAARLGADRLAHAPFTERLTDDEIAEQAASVEWISTLAIHDDAHRAIAIDNVRRFADAGGTVLYGTDMGNGPTPVDLNPRELDALREAGIDGIRLLHALAPLADDPHPLFLPDGDPAGAHPLTHLEA